MLLKDLVVRCAGLRDCCPGESVSSESSCPKISSIEQDEALSDRALSTGSWKSSSIFALSAGRPVMCPALWRFEARRGTLHW